MKIKKFDFGKNFSPAILEYKLRLFEKDLPYSVSVETQEDNIDVTVTLKFFNAQGEELVGGNVFTVPKGTVIEDAELNYDTKELILNIVGREPIVADLSGLLDDLAALHSQLTTTTERIDSEIASLDDKIDTTANRIDSDVSSLNTTLTNEISRLDTKIDTEVKQLNSQLDVLDQKVDVSVDQLSDDIDTLDEKVDTKVAEVAADLVSAETRLENKKVDKTTKVNKKALTGDIELTSADIEDDIHGGTVESVLNNHGGDIQALQETKLDKSTKINGKEYQEDTAGYELDSDDIIDTYTTKPISQAIEDLFEKDKEIDGKLDGFIVNWSEYVVATDDDFIVKDVSNNYFQYIGTDEYIIVPKMIQGYQVTNLRSGSSASMFKDVSNVKGVVTTNKLSYFGYAFSGCKSTSLDLRYLTTSKLTDVEDMFSGCTNLTTLDVSNFDTSQVTSMGYMFYGCSKLTTLDVSNFDTSKVTNMRSMFRSCTNLTTLDLSNFDTSKVTNMADMFWYCTNLTTLDVSNFDTSQVTSMSYMFNGCRSLTSLDLSNFDTSKVANMDSMFSGCTNLTTLDLSNFDTSKVTYNPSMFSGVKNCTVYFKSQDEIDFFTASGSWDASNTAVIKGA